MPVHYPRRQPWTSQGGGDYDHASFIASTTPEHCRRSAAAEAQWSRSNSTPVPAWAGAVTSGRKSAPTGHHYPALPHQGPAASPLVSRVGNRQGSHSRLARGSVQSTCSSSMCLSLVSAKDLGCCPLLFETGVEFSSAQLSCCFGIQCRRFLCDAIDFFSGSMVTRLRQSRTYFTTES